MTARVAIVADDLTSAADGAGPFREAGLSALITLCGEELSTPFEVIAVDTDSRGLAPAPAGVKTAAVIRALGSSRVLLKTIDSTLRGNLRSEVRAALAAGSRSTAIVAPAFPAEGRTTANGVQLVHGVPVAHTVFGSDRSHPATTSDLLEIFPEGCRWEVGTPLPTGIVVADAGSDADLNAVVGGVPADREVLWVGSPGLAAALARRAPYRVKAVPVRLPPRRRTLVVVGSRNDISRQQLEQCVPREHVLDVSDGTTGGALAAVGSWLETRGRAGVTDRSDGASPEQVADRLAGAVSALHRHNAFDALFATGGATARALLDRLRVRSLELLSEPEPGIVAAKADGQTPFLFVLKAGGFGDAAAFRRLHSLFTATHQGQELT
ncbi:four-carbon acid sugar kinase family protein [Streptomyces sp. PU-14G]|uniref:four-carbon acid sugar kinase family protein n=1 Tax=Streptomyces sp. PU-14G TaxID=2800808 RepID=UPI0034E00633